ncbi:unnamed protein product [Cylindrotheca closterium]|uniref:VWFA domain-containing protein n=1 Tax=Cylindrotheca closterium TaxID=2856 RepID=A0AAD2CJ72_9STRA|nr:unnamed protein product [Cylindrotheca closterium]
MRTQESTDDWTVPSTAEPSTIAEDTESFANIPASPVDVLKLSFAPKHESIGVKSSTTYTSACVSIEACDMPEDEAERTCSVDICVALDVSGSMSGSKLKDCKSTLEAMLRPLSTKDRFGLITFGSRCDVVFPALLMTKENKAAALKKIKALSTNGCTNLSGGLSLAWQELLLVDNPNAVRSLFLLTDGHANEGITTTPELVEMVKSFNADSASDISAALNESQAAGRSNPSSSLLYSVTPQMNTNVAQTMNIAPTFTPPQKKGIMRIFSKQSSKGSMKRVKRSSGSSSPSNVPRTINLTSKGAPVSLFCFGYGSDHNSEMLEALSEATPGGGYYFVENDSDVFTAFGDAMGGIMSVMAQSAVLKISVPSAASECGVKIREVHHDKKVDRGDGSFTVNMGDFYAEERRDVIVDFDLANVTSNEPVLHLVATVSYMNVLTKKNTQGGPRDCSISRPDSADLSAVNQDVEAQWLRVCVVREMEEADKEARSNNREQAQARMRRVAATIQASPAYNLEDSFYCSLQQNVDESMVDYEASSYKGHRSKNIAQTLKKQRACSSKSSSNGYYQTKSKKKMSKAFEMP